jgi:hypothetical protein
LENLVSENIIIDTGIGILDGSMKGGRDNEAKTAAATLVWSTT